MKRYLTLISILLGLTSAVVGIALGMYWSAAVGWFIAIIFFLISLYTTKYIPRK